MLPGLAPLNVLSLWSLVLVYVGLPRLMHCPDGLPRGAYTLAVALVMALVAYAAGLVLPTFPGRPA